MAFFSVKGMPGADFGKWRSAVGNAAGLTDLSRACLAAVISMSRPRGRCERPRFLFHILGLMRAGGDARECIEKVTCADEAFSILETLQTRRGKPLFYLEVVISRTTSCMRAR